MAEAWPGGTACRGLSRVPRAHLVLTTALQSLNRGGMQPAVPLSQTHTHTEAGAHTQTHTHVREVMIDQNMGPASYF